MAPNAICLKIALMSKTNLWPAGMACAHCAWTEIERCILQLDNITQLLACKKTPNWRRQGEKPLWVKQTWIWIWHMLATNKEQRGCTCEVVNIAGIKWSNLFDPPCQEPDPAPKRRKLPWKKDWECPRYWLIFMGTYSNYSQWFHGVKNVVNGIIWDDPISYLYLNENHKPKMNYLGYVSLARSAQKKQHGLTWINVTHD